MSAFNLFFQVAMVAIAITIGFLYINPTVTAIRDTQVLTQTYVNEKDNVDKVNAQLASRVAAINSVSSSNKQALLRYVPDTVDDIAVLKDLNIIAKQLGIVPKTLSFKGTADKKETTDQGDILAYQFELGADLTYTQLRDLLAAIEINNYLLQTTSLSVIPGEGGFLTITLNLSAFARQEIITSATFSDFQP